MSERKGTNWDVSAGASLSVGFRRRDRHFESRQFTDALEDALGSVLRIGAGGGEKPSVPAGWPVPRGAAVVVAGQTVGIRDPALDVGDVEILPRVRYRMPRG